MNHYRYTHPWGYTHDVYAGTFHDAGIVLAVVRLATERLINTGAGGRG